MTSKETKHADLEYVGFGRIAFALCVGGASMLSACTKKDNIQNAGGTTPKPASADAPAPADGAVPVLAPPPLAGGGTLGELTPADTQAAADVGLSTKDADLGRTFVNGWDGTKDEAPTTTNWSFFDVLASTVPNAGGGTVPTAGAGATVTYSQNILPVLAKSCNGCHAAGGEKADDVLTDYDAVKPVQETVVARVVNGTMPKGGLPQADRDMFAAWKAAGFPKEAAATAGTAAAAAAAATTDAAGNVEFHIKKGTGSRPWNTKETEVVLKVGKTFTIVNDDDVPHRLHTDGRPVDHGKQINPGQRSQPSQVTQPYSDGPWHDHLNDPTGLFYMRAE